MQDERKLSVCHLCLKSRECAYEYVEALTIELLRFLGLRLYMDRSGKSVKPVICQTCSESVQKCFDFKTICICSEECITSFRNEGDNVKLDLREIYLRKNDFKNPTMSNYHTICRLCMEMVESSNCTLLNNETKDAISAKAILRSYISELDLDITENPHICASCNDSLYSYFTFAKNCLNVKDEIKNCCKIEESNDENEVGSDSELRYEAKNVSYYKNDCSDIDILKNCNKNELCNETELNMDHTVQEEFQEWQIKPEVDEREEVDDVIRDIAENQTDIIYANINNIKHEEITIKTEEEDTDGFGSNILIPKNTSEVRMHSCEMCTFKTKCSNRLKHHMLIHKNSSEVTMYSCEACTYKPNHKAGLKGHMLIHKNSSELTMYSCDICTYKPAYKGNLKQHMLTHKDTSEITIYSCEVCTYKAKQKRYLKQHILTHKNTSEVTMYSCEMCTYKSKHKNNLKLHMLTHEDTSKITMYSCEICTFKAKQKGHLKQHMLIHKDASEITIYSCEICTHKTKWKGALKKHMLTPKDTSKITMYSCDICTFKTKRKGNLKKHMLTHKDTSEITMYSCEICTYKTKRKDNLKKHVLIHKDTSEVTMYSCETCTYKAKHKCNLKQHMLIHKDIPGSKVTSILVEST